MDILKDGRLDFPDDLLAELDVVVASIHQSFTLTEAEMTARLVGAAKNPYVHTLGHLTGRLLLEREPYKVNHAAVIEACAETGRSFLVDAGQGTTAPQDFYLWVLAGVALITSVSLYRFVVSGIPALFAEWYAGNKSWLYTLAFLAMIWGALIWM